MIEIVDEKGKKTRYLFTKIPFINKDSIKIGKWLILLAREYHRPASKRMKKGERKKYEKE